MALIASPADLGAIPSLFAKPQQYANFLDVEISFFGGKQPLLVVMPNGYGVQGLTPPRPPRPLARLPPPAGRTSDDLARAATVAVSKLAAAAGHPVSGRRCVGPGSAVGVESGGGAAARRGWGAGARRRAHERGRAVVPPPAGAGPLIARTRPVATLLAENRQIELAHPFGVGEDVDLDDPSVPYDERADRERPALAQRDHPGRAVDERAPQVRGRLATT